jgi:hypothetical protein
MLVRIIKPFPDQPTLTEPGDVIYTQGGVPIVDFTREAEPVQDGKADVIKDGQKIGEIPLTREPTDEELQARNPNALYIAKMDAGGKVTELKVEPGYTFAEQKMHFSGWGPEAVAVAEESK